MDKSVFDTIARYMKVGMSLEQAIEKAEGILYITLSETMKVQIRDEMQYRERKVQC